MESLEFIPDLIGKETLLKLARSEVRRFLYNETAAEKTDYPGWLSAKVGAFVSIHTKTKELRGCIGRITSDKALFQLIMELAVSAASKDYRFFQVKKSELENIVFEISVLSPLQRIYSLNDITGGKHGIYIKSENRSGTFLPQVYLETGWDIETFVGRCSRDKAGIGWNGWKDAELYIYTAEVFSEKYDN